LGTIIRNEDIWQTKTGENRFDMIDRSCCSRRAQWHDFYPTQEIINQIPLAVKLKKSEPTVSRNDGERNWQISLLPIDHMFRTKKAVFTMTSTSRLRQDHQTAALARD